jgi:hypothetical protein
VGSNPAGLTKKNRHSIRFGGFLFFSPSAFLDVFERFLTVMKQSEKQSKTPPVKVGKNRLVFWVIF